MFQSQKKQIIVECRHNLSGALEMANRWIELEPHEPDAWSARSYVYGYLKDYVRALADISEAINLAPEEPCHNFSKANLAISNKDYDLAITALTMSITKGKENNFSYYEEPSYFRRAFCYCKIGDFEMAKADLLVVSDNEPSWIDKLRSKAELMEACKKRHFD